MTQEEANKIHAAVLLIITEAQLKGIGLTELGRGFEERADKILLS